MNLTTPINNWYTDLVDIYREHTVEDGYVDKQELVLMYEKVPCRVYRSPATFTQMTQTSSEYENNDKLAVTVQTDIQTGDKLIVTRGAKLGYSTDIEVYFAGNPVHQYIPFGGVSPRISHQEIPLSGKRKVT